MIIKERVPDPIRNHRGLPTDNPGMSDKIIRRKLEQLAHLATEGWKDTRDHRYMTIGLLVVDMVVVLERMREGNPDRAVSGEIDG